MYLALNKKLIADIANTRKKLIVVMYTDAINSYNRVAYPFNSLHMQYFGLEVFYLLVLFRIIQMMKIFLYVLFKVLDRFYTRDNEK